MMSLADLKRRKGPPTAKRWWFPFAVFLFRKPCLDGISETARYNLQRLKGGLTNSVSELHTRRHCGFSGGWIGIRHVVGITHTWAN